MGLYAVSIVASRDVCIGLCANMSYSLPNGSYYAVADMMVMGCRIVTEGN